MEGAESSALNKFPDPLQYIIGFYVIDASLLSEGPPPCHSEKQQVEDENKLNKDLGQTNQ